MKTTKKLYRLLFVVLAVFTSCKDDDDVLLQQLSQDPKNITEIIADNSDLSALSTALGQVSLGEELSKTSTYTVFAPNNSAFSSVDMSALTEFQLSNMLLNHVLDTETPDFISTMQTGYLKSLASGPDGLNLSFYTNATTDLVFNGMASLLDGQYDKGATNGIVHGVDAVLSPPTIVDHVNANPDYSVLSEAIELAGLSEQLSVTDTESDNYPFTFFAPNNTAFELFMTEFSGAFGMDNLSDVPTDVLKEILLYHVVSGENVLMGDLDGTSQTSIQGEAFSINGTLIDDASYNNAGIILTDIQGVNGVVHGVDKVLLPEGVFQSVLSATLNIVERSDDRGFTDFLTAVDKAGLTSDLSVTEYTGFVPNNEAFAAFFATINNFESLDDFQTAEELETLKNLINYHLYSGAILSSQFTDGGALTSVYGDNTTIDLSGDEPKVIPSLSEAIPSKMVTTNIGANNGIIHEINRVLIPEALVSALGITTGESGLCSVKDTDLVFFDWDANTPWWGNVAAENNASLSIDGSSYGRANFKTGGTGWQDLFWRNDPSTFNGASTVGANLSSYSLKFDINIIEPISAGVIKIRFHDNDGVDAFYDWAPWSDTGEAFTTNGWETIEIPLSVLGQPDFSLVDAEFGMAFEGADVLLNFAIDNVRFDTPGCGGPEAVADTDLVFFDWDANGSSWGAAASENNASISLDGSNYGRVNLDSSGSGWNDLFWRNDGGTFNGASTVGANINDYVLKFDINTLDTPISNGTIKLRFHSDAVDAFYDWAPWNDTGDALDTEGNWITVTIPLSVIGQPDYSAVNQEFGMAFDDGNTIIPLNFAMDNVRFEAK